LDSTVYEKLTLVEYKYDFSPKFDYLRLFTTVQVAPKEIPAKAKGNGEKRLKSKNLLYNKHILTFISLKELAENKDGNIALWAAENGKLTREAMELAFSKSAELTARLISLDKKEFAKLEDKDLEKERILTLKGRVQPNSDSGLLIWHTKEFDGYVYSQELNN